MKILIVLVCVFGIALSEKCDELKAIKLKQQWNSIYNGEHAREYIALAAFRTLFAMNPNSRALFKKFDSDDTSSPKFRAHCTRVFGGLDSLISLLGNEKVFNAQLEHIRVFHTTIPNLKLEYFQDLGTAFEEVFSVVIDNLDKEAFGECYDVIVNGITATLS
ncbi:unnamed protein product [Owenia fusiformis]|uniref:Extracellular globin n=1 Tax=Owenia fusiformis TaxID=6347 RepID=A0A8J1T5S1_OWEFU|nr:unnamed protein product [Owenia fusiformis]